MGYSHQVELLKLYNCCLIALPFDDICNFIKHWIWQGIVNLAHHKFSQCVGYSQWLTCRSFWRLITELGAVVICNICRKIVNG